MYKVQQLCDYTIGKSLGKAKNITWKLKRRECPLCGKKFRSKNKNIRFCSNCRRESIEYLSDDWWVELNCSLPELTGLRM